MHQFLNANVIATPYMSTANLPIRASIENLGTTTSSNSLILIAANVTSEGGKDGYEGYVFTANTPVTGILLAANVRRPILSIRPSLTFNGITNRGHIHPKNFEVFTSAGNCLVEIVKNPTLTGFSWQNVNAYSLSQYDVSATSLTGGYDKITSFVINTSNNNTGLISINLADVLLCTNYNATSSDILSIVCTSSANATAWGDFNWVEEF